MFIVYIMGVSNVVGCFVQRTTSFKLKHALKYRKKKTFLIKNLKENGLKEINQSVLIVISTDEL